jgi:predicted phage baseplate assembly protein
MPLQAPVLDDRTFEDLYREAILRVPVYTPEWTDFNESDPGATLLELFAWLTELTIFRLNQVPDVNYIKFLQLMGLELRPAQPATAHLTFTPTAPPPTVPAAITAIDAGSQIGATPASGGLLIFETVDGLGVIPYLLGSLQVFDGTTFTSVLPNNQATGNPYYPFGPQPQPGCALYLGFDPPKGYDPTTNTNTETTRLFPEEMRFRVFLAATTQTTRVEVCKVGADPNAQPPVTLVWEYKQRDGPYWTPLVTFSDASLAFTREGDVLVEGPALPFPTVEGKQVPGETAGPRFWLRARIAQGTYPVGLEPQIDFIRPNVVSAINLATTTDEQVGVSDGSPDQTYTLRHTPVFAGSLAIAIEQGDQVDSSWVEVGDFLASGPDDPHYTLDPASGAITFGDGAKGRIPPPTATIVAASYRYGGGTSGNVLTGAINSPLLNLGAIVVKNERPAVGGRDEQSVDELRQQAPARLRCRDRAVTADDYRALAEQAGGVARAVALPGMHPDVPGSNDIPGVISVAIVPDLDAASPVPSLDQLQSTATYLDGFRVITAEVYIRPPTYMRVRAVARVTCNPLASPDRVSQAVSDALNTFLDPLGRTWSLGLIDRTVPPLASRRDFGQAFVPTRLYGVIQDVKDVREVSDLRVFHGEPGTELEVAPSLFGTPIPLPADGLLYGQGHTINVSPA